MNINIIAILRKDKINSNNYAPVHLRFTQNRKIRYVSTGIKINADNWDFANQRIRESQPNTQELQYVIDTKLNDYRRKIKRLEALEMNVTLDNLLETNGRKINCTVGEYLKQTIERLETLGKYTSASKLSDTTLSMAEKTPSSTFSPPNSPLSPWNCICWL